MATEGNKRAYAPHLVREIAEYFDEWKFFGDNQGSTVYYCLELHDKIWDEEDGTFSLVEIAAHARQEMAKAGWSFSAHAHGSVGLINTGPEIDTPFCEKFECYDAVDEADATLACIAAALRANAWAGLMASADSAFHRAKIGRTCPADVPGSTWLARLAVQQTDCDRAMLGWHCPVGVEGATWQARLALQSDDLGRAILGWHCPDGVEGATWQARLALQRDAYERSHLYLICPAGVPGDPR